VTDAGLKVIVSNCPERLVQAILEHTADTADVLSPDLVVVQTRPMQRFLSLYMAERRGVCAGVDFPYPVALVYSLFRQVLPATPKDETFLQNAMTWCILEVMPNVVDAPEAGPLRSYLGDGNDLKAYQLARVTAGLFDQYLIFRPDLIEAWERGEPAGRAPHAAWQALLWRTMASGHETQHRVALRQAFLDELASDKAIPGLPRRLSVFGVASLPPFYLEVFSALAKRIQVTVYQLGHCGTGLPSPLALGLDTVGTEFRELLRSGGGVETCLAADPGLGSLLSQLQRDLGFAVVTGGKATVRPNDQSVQFHSCHNRMREVEILHQNILGILSERKDIQTRDILVLCPELSSYAPYVNAVFGSPPEERFFIPIAMVGLSLGEESTVVRAFLEALALAGGRFELPAVLSLLQCSQVRKRFGISDSDLPDLQRWLMDAGVRWGLDSRDRKDLGLPELREYTWEAALERLVVGYALPSEEHILYGRTAPMDVVEGSRAELLDSGLRFCRTLFGFVLELREARPVEEWTKLLREMLDGLFRKSRDESDEGIEDVRQALRAMADMARAAECTRPVGLSAIQEALNRQLGDEQTGFRSFSGGVTFAPPGEMRQIPFKVVCLLGMNDGVFPRSDIRPSFDLMAHDRRTGDRSLREDDRRLYLEALLCARETLLVSYLGQSMEDNSPIPPSVLVSELMDHIEDHFVTPDGKSPLPSLIRQHRLQSFHPDYFRPGTGLFSFYGEPQPPAAEAEEDGPEAAPVVRQEIPEPGEEWTVISTSQLSRFLVNPSQFYLERRLHLTLTADSDLPQAEEPLTGLGALDEYVIGQELLEAGDLSEKALVNVQAALVAGHRLPVGGLAGITVDSLASQARALLKYKEDLVAGQPRLAPVEGELLINERTLNGSLQGLYPRGLIRCRLASIKPKDRLRAWVDHLFLNTLALQDSASGLPRETYVLGKDKTVCLSPVDDPVVILGDLLALLEQGLRRPLPFFPMSSWTFVETLNGKRPEKAPADAIQAWDGRFNSPVPGEGKDRHIGFCFPNRACLEGKEFQELAVKVWGVYLRHEESV
jgi:exodeoxyribonuclease V gamma subunit